MALRGLLWFLIGLGVGGGLLYATLFSGALVEAGGTFLWAFLAVAVGAFVARGGKRGALVGFLLLFVPLAYLALLLLQGAATLGGEAEESVAQFAEALGLTLLATLGIVFLLLAAIAGTVGLIVGGIVGWIGGKVFALRRKARPTY